MIVKEQFTKEFIEQNLDKINEWYNGYRTLQYDLMQITRATDETELLKVEKSISLDANYNKISASDYKALWDYLDLKAYFYTGQPRPLDYLKQKYREEAEE